MPEQVPHGAIVGVVDVVEVVGFLDDPLAEGPYVWVLGNAHAFPVPIPCKGAQGLWNAPAAAEVVFRKTK